MYGLLNLGSLVLAFAAWALPIAGLASASSWADGRRAGLFSALSLMACSAALLLQILYTGHLVAISDWSALLDTHRAVTIASAALVLVTAALNGALLCQRQGPFQKKKERP